MANTIELKISLNGAGDVVAKIKGVEAATKDSADKQSASWDKVGNSLDKLGKATPAWLGPLLAGLPTVGTLLGVVAGSAIGLSGAVIAGGGALAAFGAVAKPVLSDALTASQAVRKAQDTYNTSIATGTNKATAYKTEQKAIATAYAGMSQSQIALSKQLGNMAGAWQKIQQASTPVVSGAITPWVSGLTSLIGKLNPVINATGTVVGALGRQFSAMVNTPAFTTFRDFIAGTGSSVVGAAGSTLLDLVNSLIILLPKFNPLIQQAVGWIGNLGPAVLTWSQSGKASTDITNFMNWFNQNGPAVGSLLKNIGGALKTLGGSLAWGSGSEIGAISGFFGLIAKLPPGLAGPITTLAGSLLLLNKIGVLKVGLQIVGKAVSWLTGGVISIGSGEAAAVAIREAMVSGGASAAAAIREAMVSGGAAAGAEEGVAAGTGEAAAMEAAGPAIGGIIGLAVAAQIGGYFAEKQFSNMFSSGVKASSSVGVNGSSGEAASIGQVLAGTGTNTSLKISVNSSALDSLLKELGYTQSSIGQINKLTAKPGSNVGQIDALIYKLGGTQSDILAVNKLIAHPGSDSSALDQMLKKINLTPGEIDNVNKLVAKPGSNTASIDALLRQIGLTPGQIAAANKLILKPKSDTSPVSSLQGAINSLHGKSVTVSVAVQQALNNLAVLQGDIANTNSKSIAMYMTTYYKTVGNPYNSVYGSNGNLSYGSGGAVGAAAGGGARNGLVMVGEHGRELVRLPGGSTVHSNSDTESMVGSGGGSGVIQLEVSGGGSPLEQLLAEFIRNFVRVKAGGNVQLAFGRN